MAGNKVRGEPATPIVTANGVNKVSCIDPKSAENALDGFTLPATMGADIEDGACSGASVSIYKASIDSKRRN